jgi:hypothetical protein
MKETELKQIEEMARKNCHIEYNMKNYKTCKECYEDNYRACRVYEVCRNLYNAGYRKQSENVVELPCNVGDTVYCIWQYNDFCKTGLPVIEESKVTAFVIDEGEVKIIPENYAEKIDSWYRLRAVAFNNDDAEKILAKLKGGE